MMKAGVNINAGGCLRASYQMGSGVGFTDSYIKLIHPAFLNIPLLVLVVLVEVRRASLSPSRVPFVQTFITPTRVALSIHPYPNT